MYFWDLKRGYSFFTSCSVLLKALFFNNFVECIYKQSNNILTESGEPTSIIALDNQDPLTAHKDWLFKAYMSLILIKKGCVVGLTSLITY